MDLIKRIKFIIVLLIILIVGYVLYNQIFYVPPERTPISNNPIIVPDPNEEVPIEQPFEGIVVEWMPIVDESDRVKLYLNQDELFQSPLILYSWNDLNLPVYQKLNLTEQEIDLRMEKLLKDLTFEITNKQCDDLNQDDLKVSMCVFDQGYSEVVQDGSFYVILHGENIIPIESYEVDDIKNAIQDSWISSLVNLDNIEVLIKNQSYDTFGEKVYEIVITKMDKFAYEEKYTLMVSYLEQAIVGISKNADRGEEIKRYPILSVEQINKNIKQGLYFSNMVDPNMLKDVTILGYGLTYNTTMFSNVILPIVEVYVTSDDPSFVNCFDVKGIVVHPLKAFAIDPINIRAK